MQVTVSELWQERFFPPSLSILGRYQASVGVFQQISPFEELAVVTVLEVETSTPPNVKKNHADTHTSVLTSVNSHVFLMERITACNDCYDNIAKLRKSERLLETAKLSVWKSGI